MGWGVTGNIRGPAGVDAGGAVDLPLYAPSGLQHAWDPSKAAYNRHGGNMHKRRAKQNIAASNAGAYHWGWLGDSTLADYNGATYDSTKGIAWRATRAMAMRMGHPYPTHGWSLANNANTAVGSRWSTTGTVSATNCLVWSTAGTATHTTPDQCNAFAIAYSNLGSSFTYKVDGEATARNVVTNGTNTVGILVVTQLQNGTALANGFHTIVCTMAVSGILVGQRCYNTTVNQLHCHDLALGGSRANSGPANVNWSSQQVSGPAGLGFIVSSLISAAGLTVDDLTVICGNNDNFQGAPPADVIGGIHTMGTGFFAAGTPWSMVHPPMVHSDTNLANFSTLGGLFFDQADADNVPFLDWNTYVNEEASFTADGQAGADATHPNWGHQLMIGNWITECLMPFSMLASDFWPGVIGLGGGRYKVIETAGVYPPRPNVPAGAVDFYGPDQAVDMLNGDGWMDLP